MNKTQILNTIEELEGKIAELKSQLNNNINDEPPFIRLNKFENYYFINKDAGEGFFIATEERDEYTFFDNNMYKNNNYFPTKEQAEKCAEELNLFMKLKRYAMLYPNDTGDSIIYYSVNENEYDFIEAEFVPNGCILPTFSIDRAEFICKELNNKQFLQF